MKLRLTVACLAFFAFGSAYTAENPNTSKADARIQYQTYNAGDVTVIKGKNGFTTAIRFDDDEKINNAYLGFNGWAVEDRGNILFIKPVAVGTGQEMIEPTLKDWNTNLLVTTNKRHYAFDLILVPEDTPNSAYFVSFQYPNERAKEKKAAETKLAKENAKKQEEERLKQEEAAVNAELDVHGLPRNWDYGMKVGEDSRTIAPSYAYDDGVRTYLGFDNTASIPSVFYYQGETEMASNTSQKVQGDYTEIVIHKVADRFILRSGDQVVGILNHGFGKNPSHERSTINTDIDREIIN